MALAYFKEPSEGKTIREGTLLTTNLPRYLPTARGGEIKAGGGCIRRGMSGRQGVLTYLLYVFDLSRMCFLKDATEHSDEL